MTHAFVSHTHMDHFAGFDALLRVLGREKVLHLFGPPGFVERVEHKLAGYTWNLVANYESDFVVRATEVSLVNGADTILFRSRTGFRREIAEPPSSPPGVLLDEDTFRRKCGERASAAEQRHLPCSPPLGMGNVAAKNRR